MPELANLICTVLLRYPRFSPRPACDHRRRAGSRWSQIATGRTRTAFGWLKRIWTDGGYAGQLQQYVANLPRHRQVELEIVKRSDDVKGFKVLPKRWIVERTFGWFVRNRRLVRDYEVRTDIPRRSSTSQ
jgi:transposase